MGNMTVLGTHDGGRNMTVLGKHDGGQNPYGQYDCSGNIHDDGQNMGNMTVLGTYTMVHII